MIIQCDHCRAKFRMDDSKLASGPVKVRCAKCKGVFVVQKEEEAAESFQLPSDFEVTSSSATPATASSSAEESPTPSKEPEGFGFDGFSAGDSEFSFNIDVPPSSDAGGDVAISKAHEGTANEFDWKDSSAFGEPAVAEGLDLTGFSGAAAADKSVAPPDEFDFGDISIGEPSSPAHSAAGDSAAQDDFAMDFGEVSFSDTPAPETTPSSFDFTFSPDMEESAPAGSDVNAEVAGDLPLPFSATSPEAAGALPVAEAKVDTPSFGDFDFGEVEAEEEAKPFPPFAPPRADIPAAADDLSAMPPQVEELPPTSLTTRKKRGSLFPLFVIMGAILLVVALAGSGVYFFGGPKVFSRVGLGFLVEWYGQKGGEEGEIALRSVKAEYVANKEAGELFVVRGEALNNYKKPRASIQVKTTLLGSGGTNLKTRAAFCGNSLSNEQLASMPLAKIEEVMNNQFGDSLANLGVKPGNAIPFVVVISGIPKEAIDFSVQVGGSTVATQ